MRKLFFISFLAVFFICSCSNLNGPVRDVSIENTTDIEQHITLIINDSKEQSYTVPAHDTVYTTITGGFKVKDNLNFKYEYTFTAENCVRIINAKKMTNTVVNNLPVSITLLDTADPDFSIDIVANSSKEIDVYMIKHQFTLKDSKSDGGFNYIESENTQYYYSINNSGNGLLITSL